MHIDPSAPRRSEFYSVRSPIGLDGVTQLLEGGQHRVLESGVDVDVDVAMRPSLAPCKRINSPASFQPEPAADRAYGVQHCEHLLEGHTCGGVHAVIITPRAGTSETHGHRC